MIRLRLVEDPVEIRHPDDVDRIVQIMASRGYVIDEITAQMAWEKYSDTYAAGWMLMDEMEDDQIAHAILIQCKAEIL